MGSLIRPTETANRSLDLLLVEQDEGSDDCLLAVLSAESHVVTRARGIERALGLLRPARFDAIILNRSRSRGEGLSVLRAAAADTPLIVASAEPEIADAIEALRHGAADYLTGPVDPVVLRDSLGRLARRLEGAAVTRRNDLAFRGLVEVSDCIVMILCPQSRVIYISPYAERLLGRTLAEVRGMPATELLHPIREPEVTEELRGNLLAGIPLRGFEEQLDINGRRHWIVWNVTLLEEYEGGPAFIGVGTDITRLKEAQQRALDAERLAAVGQMVSGLTHESRNALQRSQACLEMLGLEVQGSPTALSLIERLQDAQNHLANLYDDVQNYARPLNLELRSADLRESWRSAWRQLGRNPSSVGERLVETAGAVETWAILDPFRMTEVFRNIFENSLAAGPSPVLIELDCREGGPRESPGLVVTIRDQGPGLSEEQRSRIFEPFFTTKTRGTGLGMPIARRIVEAHGGRIEVAPAGPPGTSIVITLPRGAS